MVGNEGSIFSLPERINCIRPAERPCAQSGLEDRETLVPEEASHSSSFPIYIQILKQFGLRQRPAKGPQKPSNALVRCLFWDSNLDLLLRQGVNVPAGSA